MKIPKLGIDYKKAVVILGAGASRGASCFEGNSLTAPLDTDFFGLMQKVQHRDTRLENLIRFVREELGEGARPRMEEFFTQLEALEDFHTNLKITRGPKIKAYATQLDQFVEAIAVFFGLIFKDDKGDRLECRYHDAIAKALYAEDVVISFNYDCLMDDALTRHANNRWDPNRSYGIGIDKGTEHWKTKVPQKGQHPHSPIALLKLHGSLSWKRGAHGTGVNLVDLRQDPYEDVARSKSEVVPPVWDKRISKDEVYKSIWKQARTALPLGPVLIVAGYSVPPTDMLSQVLMRVSASERATNRKLTHLILVNPDPEARSRMIQLMHAGLSTSTVIVELSNMKELADLLS